MSASTTAIMPASSTSDLNRKNTTGHADVEKQPTQETASVPIAAPKTLGAGVSKAGQIISFCTNNRRQRSQ